MSDKTPPGPGLYDRIHTHLGEAWPRLLIEDPVFLDQFTEETLTVVRPELAERDAEIERLKGDLQNARALLRHAIGEDPDDYDPTEGLVDYYEQRLDRMRTAWWSARIGRANARLTLDRTRDALSEAIAEERELTHAAEAELGQLKTELRRLRALVAEAEQSLPIQQRRLLAISRMVFDRHAEGDTLSRDEAADLAQRIVDEIGHSVTEEPALGPSFRVEIAELKAANDRVRALHARCEGHTRDCDECLGHNNVCSWCVDPYPCPTIAALDQPAVSKET